MPRRCVQSIFDRAVSRRALAFAADVFFASLYIGIQSILRRLIGSRLSGAASPFSRRIRVAADLETILAPCGSYVDVGGHFAV